jgi:aryl-alcohol dehydrogenase-like predicted oxidoreductase
VNATQLPRTDITAPRLAVGCAMSEWDCGSPDFVPKSVSIIKSAVDHRITFFDIPDVYGNDMGESSLGEAVKQLPGLRSKLTIQTKYLDRFLEGEIDNSHEHIMASVAGSLQRLGMNHVDELLLRWPDSQVNPERSPQRSTNLSTKAGCDILVSAITVGTRSSSCCVTTGSFCS